VSLRLCARATRACVCVEVCIVCLCPACEGYYVVGGLFRNFFCCKTEGKEAEIKELYMMRRTACNMREISIENPRMGGRGRGRMKRGRGIKGRVDRSRGIDIHIAQALTKINPTDPFR
jgi:hypothetical protein